jgi:hypothetical protein
MAILCGRRLTLEATSHGRLGALSSYRDCVFASGLPRTATAAPQPKRFAFLGTPSFTAGSYVAFISFDATYSPCKEGEP